MLNYLHTNYNFPHELLRFGNFEFRFHRQWIQYYCINIKGYESSIKVLQHNLNRTSKTEILSHFTSFFDAPLPKQLSSWSGLRMTFIDNQFSCVFWETSCNITCIFSWGRSVKIQCSQDSISEGLSLNMRRCFR